MALTAAEKQRAYRARCNKAKSTPGTAAIMSMGLVTPGETVTEIPENVTESNDVTPKRDETASVTNSESAFPASEGGKSVTSPPLSITDLPADVQANIERMCSENNDGIRAASHSRAAMTERALAYQRIAGRYNEPETHAHEGTK